MIDYDSLFDSLIKKNAERYNYSYKKTNKKIIFNNSNLEPDKAEYGLIFNDKIFLMHDSYEINEKILNFASLLEILPYSIQMNRSIWDCVFISFFAKTKEKYISEVKNFVLNRFYEKITRHYQISKGDFEIFLTKVTIDEFYSNFIPYLPKNISDSLFFPLLINFVQTSVIKDINFSVIRKLIRGYSIEENLLLRGKEFFIDYPKINLCPIRIHILHLYPMNQSSFLIENLFSDFFFYRLYYSERLIVGWVYFPKENINYLEEYLEQIKQSLIIIDYAIFEIHEFKSKLQFSKSVDGKQSIFSILPFFSPKIKTLLKIKSKIFDDVEKKEIIYDKKSDLPINEISIFSLLFVFFGKDSFVSINESEQKGKLSDILNLFKKLDEIDLKSIIINENTSLKNGDLELKKLYHFLKAIYSKSTDFFSSPERIKYLISNLIVIKNKLKKTSIISIVNKEYSKIIENSVLINNKIDLLYHLLCISSKGIQIVIIGDNLEWLERISLLYSISKLNIGNHSCKMITLISDIDSIILFLKFIYKENPYSCNLFEINHSSTNYGSITPFFFNEKTQIWNKNFWKLNLGIDVREKINKHFNDLKIENLNFIREEVKYDNAPISDISFEEILEDQIFFRRIIEIRNKIFKTKDKIKLFLNKFAVQSKLTLRNLLEQNFLKKNQINLNLFHFYEKIFYLPSHSTEKFKKIIVKLGDPLINTNPFQLMLLYPLSGLFNLYITNIWHRGGKFAGQTYLEYLIPAEILEDRSSDFNKFLNFLSSIHNVSIKKYYIEKEWRIWNSETIISDYHTPEDYSSIMEFPKGWNSLFHDELLNIDYKKNMSFYTINFFSPDIWLLLSAPITFIFQVSIKKELLDQILHAFSKIPAAVIYECNNHEIIGFLRIKKRCFPFFEKAYLKLLSLITQFDNHNFFWGDMAHFNAFPNTNFRTLSKIGEETNFFYTSEGTALEWPIFVGKSAYELYTPTELISIYNALQELRPILDPIMNTKIWNQISRNLAKLSKKDRSDKEKIIATIKVDLNLGQS